jgi:hypothetical protein
MTQLGIYFGHWIGGSMVIIGSWILAQATLDNVERFVGGSIIVIVGAFIIRWVLKTSERVEATWSGALEAANIRAEKAELRCVKYQEEIDLAEAKYDQERQLRISLEERGLTDRRKHEE